MPKTNLFQGLLFHPPGAIGSDVQVNLKEFAEFSIRHVQTKIGRNEFGHDVPVASDSVRLLKPTSTPDPDVWGRGRPLGIEVEFHADGWHFYDFMNDGPSLSWKPESKFPTANLSLATRGPHQVHIGKKIEILGVLLE